MKKSTSIFLLIGCISITILLGVLPSYFTRFEIMNWHAALIKPSFNPPNYLFGPVWTLLYTLMGITLYRIIKSSDKPWRRNALILFTIQFTLNFLWTFIFFKLHQLELAFAEIVMMWLAIFAMIYHLYKKDKLSALINIPYLAWVTFASALNLAFVLLN